jgi:putative ABC transport system ATP-binding protein
MESPIIAPDSTPYQSVEMRNRQVEGDLQPPGIYPELSDAPFVPASQLPRPLLEDEVVVRLDNVHKTYLLGLEGVTALRGVTISVKKGEFVCILGTSGGGKTTMLNMIGTIDKPTKGDVWLGGVRIKSSTRDTVLANMRLHKLAFVFQSFNLIASMTALENVELPMLLLGAMGRGEIRTRARELLEKVGLAARAKHFPSQLSGGEQQRVTIARALANDPEILLLDEPTGDLDTKNTDIIMHILLDLHRVEKRTLVMVTHDVGLKNFADRVIRVLDGKIMRIEEVSEEERGAAIERLGTGGSRLRTGMGTELPLDGSKFQTRSPADYPALRQHLG